MSSENSQIANFFKNQTVFLTGGTGLLGKLLIEKILRTCWDVNRIYVLMRPKGGKTAKERFEEFFDNPCFDLIRHKNVNEKVFLIGGDCRQPALAIEPEDAEILRNETTCVFHAAADVNFDQSLKEVGYNVRATRDLLELAKDIKNLKVLVYVSTAYSNCPHPHIKEDFYKPPLRPDFFLDLVNQFDDAALLNMTPTLLGEWPNTYVFMKSMSEDLFKNPSSDVPMAIVRPSIILSTLNEPRKGWTDNSYGIVGITLGAFAGVVRSYYAGKKNKVELVPADHVCNCILAAAWKTAQANNNTIYNCVGEPIAVEKAGRIIDWFYWEFASDKYLWYKSFKFRENKFWHDLCIYSHLIPAYLLDGIFLILGKPANIVKKYRHVNKAFGLTSHFARREWIFDQDNVTNLWREMSEEDRKIFAFNTKVPDWYQYYRDCALGIRLYLLRDPIQTLPKGRRKLRMLFVAHYAVVGLLLYFLFAFLRFVFGLF